MGTVETPTNGQHPSFLRSILESIIGALVLVFWDVVVSGSYLFSILVCPIWFIVAVVLAIVLRPSWKVAAARVLFPLVTLFLVFANASLQKEIAMANAARVIQACKQYHEANGTYPKRLGDLTPGYLSSVPMAKYCVFMGGFFYFYQDDGESHGPVFFWTEVPPFGRRIYNFEKDRWGYLD